MSDVASEIYERLLWVHSYAVRDPGPECSQASFCIAGSRQATSASFFKPFLQHPVLTEVTQLRQCSWVCVLKCVPDVRIKGSAERCSISRVKGGAVRICRPDGRETGLPLVSIIRAPPCIA